ncbi:6-bladed beta-propeller [Aestuariivivens sp. NBU2969]|uniref:6-bladed beta-propeller n=1 Tax=Aestuariivivens sp. NBU2969 TaxID=2873267 RepID=UPI001CBF24B4|nr:6-bladed beta-propeller [Aestuariivivens sp. NBU2969]
MHQYKIHRFFLITGLILFSQTKVQSQDTTYVDILDFYATNTVSWINQIPALKENVKKTKKGWFKRLLLGKSDITTLQKPVGLIGFDHEDCIIFDQGHGTIFMAEDNKLEIPKFLRKDETYYPSLVGACMLPDKRILFTDSKLNKIFSFSADRKEVTELNSNLQLTQPTGIAFNKHNNQIWVVETGLHRITILDPFGQFYKTIGTRGKGKAEFNYPTSIWIDHNGWAYVVDALNYRIQIFDDEGRFISMFGQNGNGTGFLASPKGIATDSYGHIYIVDALFHGVQIFDAKGNYLYQFGTQGSNPREFWMPSGIFIDAKDHIYIADSYNNRIQVFELNYSP